MYVYTDNAFTVSSLSVVAASGKVCTAHSCDGNFHKFSEYKQYPVINSKWFQTDKKSYSVHFGKIYLKA